VARLAGERRGGRSRLGVGLLQLGQLPSSMVALHRTVRAFPQDLCSRAQQIVRRERERPVEVDQLAAAVPTGVSAERQGFLFPVKFRQNFLNFVFFGEV